MTNISEDTINDLKWLNKAIKKLDQQIQEWVGHRSEYEGMLEKRNEKIQEISEIDVQTALKEEEKMTLIVNSRNLVDDINTNELCLYWAEEGTTIKEKVDLLQTYANKLWEINHTIPKLAQKKKVLQHRLNEEMKFDPSSTIKQQNKEIDRLNQQRAKYVDQFLNTLSWVRQNKTI